MTGSQRLDQWLWHARFFKTRSLATKQVTGGHVRVDGERVTKAAFALKPGHVLTFRQARQIKVIEVTHLANRRGPAPEAQALYLDRSPPPEDTPPANPKFEGKGRPSGKDRRNARLHKGGALE
ncbi:MAG: RNA-binding S4 domain-containing protein [Silicimonas sp.]|nr:RNA-binding S4 domain-containing protein [Silicimonas sp.]